MKSKSFSQHLIDKYGGEDKIPNNLPDAELDKFVKRANDKANIKDLGNSIDDTVS